MVNRFFIFLVEWATSMTNYVDPFAKYNFEGNATVKDSLGYIPHPPVAKPEKQGPGIALSEALGEKQRELDQVINARREVRYGILSFYNNCKHYPSMLGKKTVQIIKVLQSIIFNIRKLFF